MLSVDQVRWLPHHKEESLDQMPMLSQSQLSAFVHRTTVPEMLRFYLQVQRYLKAPLHAFWHLSWTFPEYTTLEV